MNTPSSDPRASSPDRTTPGAAPLQGTLSPRRLLSQVLADCAGARRERGRPVVSARIDVAERHDVPLAFDAALLRRVVEPLVLRALESAAVDEVGVERPPVHEVAVSGVDLGDAFEIEVADSGPALSFRLLRWLDGTAAGADLADAPAEAGFALAAARAAAARLKGTLRAVNCPDGGVAITLRLPRRQAGRLAA